jgi:uridylate kinase
MNDKVKFERILLKIGGEALAGPDGFGVDPLQAEAIAKRVVEIHNLGHEIAIVIGAGNLWRGIFGLERGMDRATADHMGMLGTVINSLALMDAIERAGVPTRVQTAIEMRTIAEPYIRRRAIRHIEKGRVVIFGSGTGNPFFSTDTAAALRAVELGANVLIKATKVDGLYESDPVKNPDAKLIKKLTYLEAINMRQGVMDNTAITLCMENELPIMVINFWDEEALKSALRGEEVGTLVSD